MLQQNLKQLGLHENEIKVYLALFSLGKVRAAKIIEKTNLHRNLVYVSLESLIGKGLASKAEQGKVAVFEANSPGALVDMVKEKVELAEDAAKELVRSQEQTPRDIKIFDGVKGIVQSRDRALELPEGETLYVLGGSGLSSTPEFNAYWDKFHKKRIKKKINHRILFDRTVPAEYVAKRNLLPMCSAKYLPMSVDLPAMFDMFGDIFTISIPGDDPVAFSLRSKAASDAMKKYFEFLWNQEVRVESGMEALEKTVYEMLNELKPGEIYEVLGASAGGGDAGVQNLYDKFHKDRIKKGVVTKMLVYQESFERIKKRFEYCGDKVGKFSFLKSFISAPNIPMQINIYNNKTFLILYGKVPTILRFDKPEVYENFKAYFDSMWEQDTYVLRGGKALQEIWLEGIDTGGISFIGARGYFMDRYPELFKPIEEKMKKTKNVYWRNIVDNGMRGHKLVKFPWSQSRYSLSNVSLTVAWLYNNKVAIVNWAEDEPIIFVSENKYLVQNYNDYFEELWKQDSYILRGAKALQEIWLDAIDAGNMRQIGPRGYMPDRFPKMMEPILEKMRNSKRAPWKFICDPTMRGHAILKYPWVQTKFTLAYSKNFNVIWLWANKVAIVNWAENEPIIFVSENKHLVQSNNDYFDELWNKK